MKFGTFCSGIGAPEQSWTQLGWEPQFVSEIEPFPCAVLAHHHPSAMNLGDMTKITDEQISRFNVDVICAGTPCQSFSIAGLRKGMDDANGQLAIRYVELLGALRPARMVWENVPGVLSSWSDETTRRPSERSIGLIAAAEETRRILSDGGYDVGTKICSEDFEEADQTNDFDQFTAALVQRGYSLAWGILDAQFFNVAQRRERVFVVGSLGNWTDSAAIFFDRESLCGNPAPSREAGKKASRILRAGIDRRGEFDPDYGLAPTLPSRSRGGGGLGTDFDCDGGLIPSVVDTLSDGSAEPSSDQQGDGVNDSLSEVRPFAFQTRIGRNGRGQPKETVDALTSCGGTHADSKPHVVTPSMAVRRLTPLECERLQGFPDGHTAINFRGKPAADTPRYRAIGNSMAVPVLTWIGKRIMQMDGR